MRSSCKDAHSLPARTPQHLGLRAATKVVGQIRIANVPSQYHTANTQGDESEGTLVRSRLPQVALEDFDHLLHDFLISRLYRLPAALDVGSHSDERAAAVSIIEVLTREICVDDPLGQVRRDRTRLAPPLPGCGR